MTDAAPVMTDADRLVLALKHAAAKARLGIALAEELVLRDQVVKACFPDGVKLNLNVCDLGGGNVVRVEVKPSVKFDRGELDVALGLMRSHGEAGPELADRLVKWSPEVRIGELNKLPEPFKGIVGPVVSVENGSMSVKLRQPGEVR